MTIISRCLTHIILLGLLITAADGAAHKKCVSPLDQLNATLGGRLQTALPLAASCFSSPEGPQCETIKAELGSSYDRTDFYQGFEFIQGEACSSDPSNQCLLNPVTLMAPTNSTCKQGSVSPIFIEITGATDVQAVFSHAQKFGTLLSIKNSGHDYAMRSSRQGSLAMWTRGLKEQTFHADFVPSGCSRGAAALSAVTIGAGVSMDEAISFAHENGVLFAVGSGGSIGASGGWLLGGGHSLLSGTKGLAADRVLEYTIVTPDGQVRIANRCTNQDLFWALRGGGPGAFGLVLNSTHLAERESPVTGAVLTFPATAANVRPWVEILSNNMREWALSGWGGSSSTNYAILVNPNTTVDEARVALSSAIEYARAQGGQAEVTMYASFFDYYVDIINGTFAQPALVGVAPMGAGRIVPEAVFQNDTMLARMVDGIVDIMATGLSPTFLTTMPLLYARSHPDQETSLHSSWYHSVWEIVVGGAWTSLSSLEERRAVVAQMKNITETLISVSPDGCAYSSESSPWLDDWAEQFWGQNYAQLLEIKRTYDPTGLLSCWHCVGWNKTMPSYECISGLAP